MARVAASDKNLLAGQICAASRVTRLLSSLDLIDAFDLFGHRTAAHYQGCEHSDQISVAHNVSSKSCAKVAERKTLPQFYMRSSPPV
jgi:hypothetical protein